MFPIRVGMNRLVSNLETVRRRHEKNERFLIAAAIVILDVAVIAIPITAVFAAYVLVARPSWFRAWVERLYQDMP